MNLEDFGRQLIETGDLDPVYTAIHRAQMEKPQLYRWLFAYWCCYHAGLASWLSEQTGLKFWDWMMEFAINETDAPVGGRWPRGRERRHFRGQKAIGAVSWFWKGYPQPEDTVNSLLVDSHIRILPYKTIRERVMRWPLFGPWIAFKVGDMLERCAGIPVNFDGSDVFFFDQPKEAARLFAKTHGTDISPADAPFYATIFLESHLGELLAPPRFDRTVGIQEYETILCKWKSHLNGSYPIGIDTTELRHALEPWAAICDTARRML